jgi:beta-lactamase class A
MPIAQPPQPNMPSATTLIIQNSSVSTDLSTLSSDSASEVIKAAVLQYRIEQTIKQNEAQGITTSVDIADLRTDHMLVDHNIDTIHFAASINKLPIAWLLLQDLRAGTVNLNDTITWTASDQRGGFGVYDQPGAPMSAKLQDVVFDMLNHSGNTAVRVLVNHVLGGPAAVNNRLAQYPQLVQTRLQILDPTHFFVGNSTAGESMWVMEQLQMTKDSFEQLMQHAMETNIFVSYGVRSQLEGNGYIVLANKVGILDDPDGNNRHDVGIIYNSRTHRSFAYSFMTTNFGTDGIASMQAEASLQQMGRDLLRFAGDKPQTGLHPAQPLAPTPQVQNQQPEKKILY